jgi:FHA domain
MATDSQQPHSRQKKDTEKLVEEPEAGVNTLTGRGNPQEDEGASNSTHQLRMLPKLATDIKPWRVIFQTLSADSKVVGVDVEAIAVVGRSDSTANIMPDLDLESHDGKSLGVSRRHAILLPTGDGLCLIDLDSTNGTWINGVYLQPGQKYRLRSGDRVEFGRLRLAVRVVGAMLQGGTGEDETAVTRPKPPRR